MKQYGATITSPGLTHQDSTDQRAQMKNIFTMVHEHLRRDLDEHTLKNEMTRKTKNSTAKPKNLRNQQIMATTKLNTEDTRSNTLQYEKVINWCIESNLNNVEKNLL